MRCSRKRAVARELGLASRAKSDKNSGHSRRRLRAIKLRAACHCAPDPARTAEFAAHLDIGLSWQTVFRCADAAVHRRGAGRGARCTLACARHTL